MQGGLDVISKLIAPSFSKTGMLEQYGKSLYVFACISKIATKTASIDFHLYRITNSQGNTKEIFTHPALDLLYKINPFQTKAEFIELTIINLKCTGSAFWFKVRNSAGQVVELWNLRPDLMTIVSDPVSFIKGYELAKSDGTTSKFAPEDIVHIKYPDPLSQYLGLSPLFAAQKRVQTEEFATEWQRDFFLNSARPDALIKNPQSTLTPDQKDDIRESWNKRHRGAGNSSKIAILEGGLEYQLISLTQKEMDYIESMKFTRDDILVAFQVPKPILSIIEDVNRANSKTAMAIFLGETIKPEIARIVEKINEQLIYPDFGDEFYIDFDDPTPQNRELKLKEYESGIKNNYLLINEVRSQEGLPPVKGGWSFYMPLSAVPVGGLNGQESKNLIKRIVEQSDENGKIIEAAKKEKLYDFKGRYWLKQKFEIYEATEKVVNESLSEKKIKPKKKKKVWVALIKDEEVRNNYADMINKKIDDQSAKLKNSSSIFFKGQMHRVLGELAKKKSKTMRDKLTARSILKYDKEVGLSIDFIIPYIEQYLKDAGIEALNMLAPQIEFNETARIQSTIQKRAQFFAESVNNTTLEKLDATLAEGISSGEGIRELSDRVEAIYEDFPAYRSELIARTEATAANAEGALEGYRQSDVATGKEWINAGDSRVRDEHENGIGVGGEIVGIEENFSNGLPYPSEPNCRCVLGPAFLE